MNMRIGTKVKVDARYLEGVADWGTGLADFTKERLAICPNLIDYILRL